MRTLRKFTWVELKLFGREPITVVFTIALPFMILFVMGQAFGNTPDPEGEVFRGIGPMDYYTPAYIGLVLASIGLVALPVHLAAYRERGVLRRFRASSVGVWSMFGTQLAVTLGIAVVSGLALSIASLLVYDVHLPDSPALLVAAFIVGVLTFTAVGVLLGALMPTARAAQGAGLVLFFLMMFTSGAGPPLEVLGRPLQVIGDLSPLRHVVLLLQDPWNGFGWNVGAFLACTGFMLAAAALSARFFRWE